ncbi:MAG: recombination regulator RecX [Candidatus Pacebacteria bacterium]|nr:recombination regulator RecX [Candidatus Paceibacterota bacterium]
MKHRAAKQPSLEECREKALRLLDQRPHSVRNLRGKLRKRSFSADVIDRVIREFQRLGLLDDEALARDYCVFKRAGSRPIGRRRMMQDLHRHGIDREVAENVLRDVWDDDGEEGELQRALAAGEGKVRLMQSEDDPRKARAKLCGFLARRGFSPAVCMAAAKELMGSD